MFSKQFFFILMTQGLKFMSYQRFNGKDLYILNLRS